MSQIFLELSRIFALKISKIFTSTETKGQQRTSIWNSGHHAAREKAESERKREHNEALLADHRLVSCSSRGR